jgi:DNA-binding transcriptional LysR family regulator
MLNETDLSRVDLNLLLLFDVVRQERHVGRAAQRLNLTPSAVSHGLGRLRILLNDPVFLKTPKGVVPTQRAQDLAELVAEILSAARRVVAVAEPFNPATSTRRFTIGAPDAVISTLLPRLLAQRQSLAPGIGIAMRAVLPKQMSFDGAYAELDARRLDVAILPFAGFLKVEEAPLRFAKRQLYDEVFVVAMRARHPFAKTPSLKAYCAAQHVLVSGTGDREGYVDRLLAEKSLARHVVLTVPNFMAALAVVAETDLLGALPGSFAAAYSERFDVVTAPLPIKQHVSELHALVPKAALADQGIAWLLGILAESVRPAAS